MNNHYVKFEYKGMKYVTDYTHITQCKHSKGGVEVIMSKFNTSKKLSNVHTIGGAHLQCVNNHNAKFEYIGMKTAVQSYRLHKTDTH